MTKSIATASINRETAVALIDAALAAARAIGIPAAVAVVDATGNLRAFERTDDAPPYRRCCHRQGLEFRLVWVPDPCLERLCDQRSKSGAASLSPSDGRCRRRLSDSGGWEVDRRHRHLRRQLSAGSGCVRRGTHENRVPVASLTTVRPSPVVMANRSNL